MAGSVLGLDFGTTNSLLSTITNGRPIHLVDDKDRPHPSVVWYKGGEVVFGRKARDQLDAGAEAITGSFVRSPKRLLLEDGSVPVGGREMDPRDIITDLFNYLKSDASLRGEKVESVVLTIPVQLDGNGRRRLREAARKADLKVVQFVHEPLAALYGYLRRKRDYRRNLAELDGCRILVFDWGGGTLDLTLCQVQRDQIIQIDNLGDNEVGGDRFDEVIRNNVRQAHARHHDLEDLTSFERDEARVLLLAQCELAKIALSSRDSFTVFRRNYLATDSAARDLSVTLTREDLKNWLSELTYRGLNAIDQILERNNLTYGQISLCLPTGGMVNMPAIRDGLNERFGGRAQPLSDGDRIISEGAAWIAHDGLRLGLAKPIELLQSDNSYAPVVSIPFVLPIENETKQAAKAVYYCVDPRLGSAVFSFARPDRPKPRDAASNRKLYTTIHLEIDPNAPPLRERLELGIAIDHDYVAHVELVSTMREHRVLAEIYDLEFTLRFPLLDGASEKLGDNGNEVVAPEPSGSSLQSGVRLRSNVSMQNSWQKVPGDLVIKFQPSWFDDRAKEYSDWQYQEYVYYKDCPYCHRSRYQFTTDGCQDERCLWKRLYADRRDAGLGRSGTHQHQA